MTRTERPEQAVARRVLVYAREAIRQAEAKTLTANLVFDTRPVLTVTEKDSEGTLIGTATFFVKYTESEKFKVTIVTAEHLEHSGSTYRSTHLADTLPDAVRIVRTMIDTLVEQSKK